MPASGYAEKAWAIVIDQKKWLWVTRYLIAAKTTSSRRKHRAHLRVTLAVAHAVEKSLT